jgi:hypothetical protein
MILNDNLNCQVSLIFKFMQKRSENGYLHKMRATVIYKSSKYIILHCRKFFVDKITFYFAFIL